MKDILDQDIFDEEKPIKKRDENLFFVFLSIQVIGSIIAVFIAFLTVESIVLSGPILSLIGIVTFIFAIKINIKYGKPIGISPLLITIFWFFFISASNWSPKDAYHPVNTSLCIALLFTIYYSIIILKNRKGTKYL